MKRYRAEILGKVPNGLTHNDIHATVLQSINEKAVVESCTKRRLAGGMISIIAVFEAEDILRARQIAWYAKNSCLNFSADIIGPREVR